MTLAYVKVTQRREGTLAPAPRNTWLFVDQEKPEDQLRKELTKYILDHPEDRVIIALCEMDGRKLLRNIYCIEKVGKGAINECRRLISN